MYTVLLQQYLYVFLKYKHNNSIILKGFYIIQFVIFYDKRLKFQMSIHLIYLYMSIYIHILVIGKDYVNFNKNSNS